MDWELWQSEGKYFNIAHPLKSSILDIVFQKVAFSVTALQAALLHTWTLKTKFCVFTIEGHILPSVYFLTLADI